MARGPVIQAREARVRYARRWTMTTAFQTGYGVVHRLTRHCSFPR
jgi:hypothetical protein